MAWRQKGVSGCAACAGILLSLAAAWSPAADGELLRPVADPIVRRAVPKDAAVRAAEPLVHELFKPFPPTRASDRQALAIRMLQQTQALKDDGPAQWVLLRDARDLASGVGDFQTAARAVDDMGRYFEVEPIDLKFDALQAASARVEMGSARAMVELCQQLAAEAGSAGKFPLAVKFAQLAEAVSPKARDLRFATSVRENLEEIQRLQQEATKADAAESTLAQNADDPDANLVAGRFLCLARGDWGKGLPLLLKGADSSLKDVATQDLADPVDPDEQSALAENWKRVAEKQTGFARTGALRRSWFWYTLALPKATGVKRMVIEKRLAELPPDPKWTPVTTPPISDTPATQPTASGTVAAGKGTPATQPAAGKSGLLVFRTRNGQKYHRADCASLMGVGKPISVEAAKAAGLIPCGKCKPAS